MLCALPLDMNTDAFVAKCRKGLNAARLGISAERLESLEEAIAAGRTTGRIAHSLGLSLDTVWEDLKVEGIVDAPLTWGAVVDAWYDAAEGK